MKSTRARTDSQPQQQDMDMRMFQPLIENISADATDLISHVLPIIGRHVPEVCTQPRMATLCEQHGLEPGAAYDATV